MASCINLNFNFPIVTIGGRIIYPPCGVCANCRANEINVKNLRATWEWKNHKDCAFVDFTLDNNHLDYNEGCFRPTIRKNDFHKYIDNLRHCIKNNLKRGKIIKGVIPDFRFLACGEYGTSDYGSERPHYHCVFYGISHKSAYKLLTKICPWKKGYVDVKPVDAGANRYVLKYLEKQKKGPLNDSLYFDKGIETPFVCHSKSFGRGFFFEQAKNIQKFGTAMVDGKRVTIPSYWKNKHFFYEENHIMKLEAEKRQRILDYSGIAKSFGFQSPEVYLFYKSLLSDKSKLIKARERKKDFSLSELNLVDSCLTALKKVNLTQKHFAQVRSA